MTKNEQVALKLGLIKCDGHHPKWGEHYYCWITPGDKLHTFNFGPADYVGDIALALTLVPKIGQLVTMQYEAGGLPDLGADSWSVECISNQIWECKTTLSTAIVDAFLAPKEGE